MIDSEALKYRYQSGVDILVVYTLNYVRLFNWDVDCARKLYATKQFYNDANAVNEPPGNYDVQD